MGVNCVIDVHGCEACPQIPFQAGKPGGTVVSPVIGWNGGANSIDQLDGNVFTEFTMALGTSAAVIGFKETREAQDNPSLIEYGFYFSHLGGADSVQPMERGALKGTARARAADDTFRIARSGSVIVYLINGKPIYFSTVASHGALIVNACLYSSGDTVAV